MSWMMKERILSFFSLFTSLGTLICCALPVLLVSLGLGMAAASLASNLPWLASLSRHKEWVFAGSGILIACSLGLTYRLPHAGKTPAQCRTGDGSGCRRAGRFTRTALWASLLIWAAGFFMAYLFLPLKLSLEGS